MGSAIPVVRAGVLVLASGRRRGRFRLCGMLVTASSHNSTRQRRPRLGFAEDFRRFFLRGLATLLPTLITLWLVLWVWNLLWGSLGRHIITLIEWIWWMLGQKGWIAEQPWNYIRWYWELHLPSLLVQLIGVGVAIILVYFLGLLVGNFIGRTAWRLGEVAVMRIPLIRAIYPAVKQVTDFVLADRTAQFVASRVVAVHARDPNVWSVGLVTGPGLRPLSQSLGEEMITVFVPSTPTAFSGYVLVVPRESVVELPMTVEEAMRLLVSGGVIAPEPGRIAAAPGHSTEVEVQELTSIEVKKS